MGSKITYAVHRTVKLGRFEVLADNEHIAEFVKQADAYDFVGLCQERDQKARNASNYGTLDELEARNPEGFRNPE